MKLKKNSKETNQLNTYLCGTKRKCTFYRVQILLVQILTKYMTIKILIYNTYNIEVLCRILNTNKWERKALISTNL